MILYVPCGPSIMDYPGTSSFSYTVWTVNDVLSRVANVVADQDKLLTLWQYGLWSFQMGYTKSERFLHKDQHTQRKLLNFENWVNGEVLKIGDHFSKEVI